MGCHCWLVQQCFSGDSCSALLDKPAVAPFFNGLLSPFFPLYGFSLPASGMIDWCFDAAGEVS